MAMAEKISTPKFGERQIAKVFGRSEKREGLDICSAPISWVAGRVEEGNGGYLLWPDKLVTSLPVEFWNHQLMEVSPDSRSDLAEFVSEWGIPYHPIRNYPNLTDGMRRVSGIEATEKFARTYIPRPHRNEIAVGYHFVSEGSPLISFISSEELTHSIGTLQDCVTSLVRNGGSGDRDIVAEVLRTVNSAASSPDRLSLDDIAESAIWEINGESLACRGLLTSAICNQLIASFADSTEWRVCACDGCGRVFKRKQPDSAETRPDSDSKYCCTKCKNRQAKRNQREAAKNRIRH